MMLHAAILAFFSPGPLEIAIIAGIFLLLFSKRLPGMMRSIGSSIVQFKKGISEVEDESGKSNTENDANNDGDAEGPK